MIDRHLWVLLVWENVPMQMRVGSGELPVDNRSNSVSGKDAELPFS